MSGKVPSHIGRPYVLTKEEEDIITQRAILLGEWGYPTLPKDLRVLVKDYLDSQDRRTRFHDNLPHKDWLYGFLRRHPELTLRYKHVRVYQ